jgi:hypothetical protein
MAVFNPQNPAAKPEEFLNYSRPISDLSGNQSGKLMLEGIGDAITGTAGLLDTAIKKGISNTVYEKVDKERNDLTEGLERIKTDLDNASAAAPPGQKVAAADTGKSWLDANASMDDEELPAGLENGLSKIQQLRLAQSQGSAKINDTQYSGNVLGIAKQLRSQFPGHREYIDEVVSKASGLPVANSYYNNLMLDINRQLAASGKAKDDMGTLMVSGVKEGVPNMAAFITMRQNGNPKYPGDAYVLQRYNDWTNLQAQQKIDAATRAESTATDVDKVKRETRNLTRNVTQLVTGYTEDINALSGMPSLNELKTYFEDVSAGRIKSDDTEVQQRAMMLQKYRSVIYSQAQKFAAGPGSVIGNDAANKIVKDAMVPVDTIIELANNKETGPAFFHARQNVAIMEDEKHNNWLFNKDRMALSRNLMGARSVLGEQYFPDYIRGILEGGADKSVKDLFSQEAMAAVQPFEDARGKPIPRYMKDAVQHAKGKEGIPPEYYGDVTRLVSKIADPKMPMEAKDRLIDWAFNKKNIGVLNELKMDYRDPISGEWIPGKYRAFNIMTSPAVTQSVVETAKSKPENFQKYRNWVESEFGTLFRNDLTTLNKIPPKTYLGVGFSWNSDTNTFGLVDKKNRPVTRQQIERLPAIQFPDQRYISGMLEILEDKVNPALKRIALMHKQDPNAGDTSQYVLQVLQTSGFRPGDKISGATEGMMKALIKAGSPKLTPEQLDKQLLGAAPLEFAPQDNRGDLGTFLSNPAGKRGQELETQQTRGVIRGNLSDQPLLGMTTEEIPPGVDPMEYFRRKR